ncbi:putative protease Do-like 14 isoform X1 [Arachis stenosperma]|uniref:putative protease Do-like 14 isoform X1 n=1 Tax=Arachis stenosperma TaxID=217475 RepID=UPI0025AC9F14|nr:putative protease Do-like 14 isoform X1 [Arachis stenosperma]
MSYLLKRLRYFNSSSVFRTLAIAAAGSALLCSNGDTDFRASVKARIPVPLQDPLPFPQHLDFSGVYGTVPLYSYRDIGSQTPSSDTTKDASAAAHHGGSNPCNCFERNTIADAAAKVGPAVVNIAVTHDYLGVTAAKSIGSGTIIDKDGTILTCAHVVVYFQGTSSLSKGKIEVTLQDGRSFEGKVINADLHSDIAIVKINSKTPLPEVKLGSSSKLRPGDWVISLGCPLALQNTVTAGIVSCVDRKSSDLGFTGVNREYLQTDCATNVGNSGGPLVNIDGELVGVNHMKMFAADGLSFSVPIDSVSKIIEQFKKRGRVIRPWLGLKMLDLNDTLIAELKLRSATFPDVDKGILVPMVTPGSPGQRAGFRPGDVVIEFDGKPVQSMKEVIEIMEDRVGVPMKVVVKREGNKLVKLTVIPEESNPNI